MNTLFILLFLLAMIAIVVFLIMSVSSKAKKNGKSKQYLQYAGISAVVLVASLVGVGITGDSGDTSNQTSKDVKEETAAQKAKSDKADAEETVAIELSVNEVPNTVLLKQKEIEISGEVKGQDSVTVNGTEVKAVDHTFSTIVPLKEGENEIVVKAGDQEEKISVSRMNPEITLTIPANQTVQTKTYALQGSTEPGANVTLYKDSNKIATKTADSKGAFVFETDTASEGQYHFTVEASKADYTASKKKVTITRELSLAEKNAAKQANAKTIEYAQLEKNADKFTGEYAKFRGEIVQIIEDSGYTVIRLAVTQDSWGWDYNNILWVEYIGTTDFVDGDVVSVYGTMMGSHSYESMAGWQITVPAMLADTIK
ncbi:MAG: Ig-like domain-containing protein [Bacillus sp. (in: firmicutes)]